MSQFSNFSNAAQVEYIVGSLNNTDGTSQLSVAPSPLDAAHDPTTWPDVPFYAEIDRGTANSEVVNAYQKTGTGASTVYTVTRGTALGADALGSTTKSHAAGATIVPIFSAADARDAVLTNFIDTGSARNPVVNGGFNVWQRGAGPFTSTGMTADRWSMALGTGAACSVSRIAGITDGSRYALEWTKSTAGSTESSLVTRLEGAHTLADEIVTIAFVGKCASGTIDLEVELTQFFGTGGSPSSNVSLGRNTISLTSTATKFEQTVTIPSVVGKTFGTNLDDHLLLAFYWPSTEPTGVVTITEVQVQPGSQTGTFPRIPYTQELARCERYFQRIGGWSAGQVLASGGQAISATRSLFTIQFSSMMRVAPTLTTPSTLEDFRVTDWDSANSVVAISLDVGANPRNVRLFVDVAGGLTLPTPYTLYTESAWPYLDFSAEF